MTLEPCRFTIIPRESLESFFATHPEFAMHLAHKLIHRVRVLTERVKSLALQDVYGRFRGMLEELAVEQDGVNAGVGGQDLEKAACSGITVEYAGDVFPQPLPKRHVWFCPICKGKRNAAAGDGCQDGGL